MPVIRLEKVAKSYGAVEVCRAIDLEIADREFVTLLGPSGCGKTTTLNLIGGLDQVTSGSIFMDGRRVNDLEPIDRDVAMVFQNYALYPHMTVAQNIGFNLKLKGSSQDEIRLRVRATAESLDLLALLERYPSELSGGQQQRVAIGRAIVRQPKVFLFDEPFSNLDAALRNHMRGEVKQLHARLGVTSIFVTHDQEEALSISDRIAIMREGRIEQFATPDEVYSRPATTYVATFIGHPRIDLAPIQLEERSGTVYAKAGKAEFPLNQTQRHVLSSHGGQLDASIRPEHIALAPRGLNVLINDVQPVGPATLVRFAWDGGSAVARLNGMVRLNTGAHANVAFNSDHLLFFDRATGKLINTHEQGTLHEILA
jgi:multiple sugar transport system ATP-binding protein